MPMNYLHLFSAFSSHLEAIVAHGGYVFLFITTLLEGVPLIGMAVPGHVTIVIAGFLARVGLLDLYWVLGISLVGAILGDYIGFYLGRKYGLSFIDRLRPYFFITDAHIERAHNLLNKHTGKAMVIGRFSPITRALMPFLVGTTQTSPGRFWFFNTLGGISWAIISIFVGYIFGAGYHVAASYMGKVAVSITIVALVMIWGYRFINLRFHIFKRYELFVLILNIISLYALARTIQDAWSPHSFMANFDVYVNIMMDGLNHAHAWIISCATLITHAGGTVATIGLGVLITVGLVLRKKWRSAAIMFLAIGSTGFTLGVLKEFFMRARPDNALITMVNDPSFPSGHAGMAAAFFVIAAYLLIRHVHSLVWRELIIVGCVIATIAIGLSRIVLNVHWASDVIAGWSLGIFCATASILAVRYLGALVVPKKYASNTY